MESTLKWPEPNIRVQSLSESGATMIPDKYVKPASDRPSFTSARDQKLSIPVIDLASVADGSILDCATVKAISDACKEWGFFQVVNHGVCPKLRAQIRKVWREFFSLPVAVKEAHANDPTTYVGYGSRTGVQKDIILDWTDYFFLELQPEFENYDRWPTVPSCLRKTTKEYAQQLGKLCGLLMKLISASLGLDEGYLQKAFGGDNAGTAMRVGFYPKCPQPDLTFGLSAHSDPGGLTVLFADEHVKGLQVHKGEEWIDVQPEPNAFIVNLGDQIQLISNGSYKSVEHRVIVNSATERLSFAFFYNPDKDLPIGPAQQLLKPNQILHIQPIAYKEYRLQVRLNGPEGKRPIETLMAA